jgi:P4 family phage/plasmid primase-like protien
VDDDNGAGRIGASPTGAEHGPASSAGLGRLAAAGISADVVRARGYTTLEQAQGPDVLRAAGYRRQLWETPSAIPGVLIPLFNPRGEPVSSLYRPNHPLPGGARYEAPAGRPVVDVHPFNTAKMADHTVELWLTDGVEEADAITSAGGCALSLLGGSAWRSRFAAVADWDDVRLPDRRVFVCFSSDARTDPHLARAMARWGSWLTQRGAAVRYAVCDLVPGMSITAVNDWLSVDFTLAGLREAATDAARDPEPGADTLSDGYRAEALADDVLRERYRYVPGMRWLRHEGHYWRECDEPLVVEEARQYLKTLPPVPVLDAPGTVHPKEPPRSGARLRSIVGLTRGFPSLRAAAEDFDADPELLNAGNGVVNLRTLQLTPHDPDLLMRRGTDVDYVPGATHPDWTRALTAFTDAATEQYALGHLGSGAVGSPPAEDVLAIWQGSGANGKSTVLGAVVNALGTYAQMMPGSLLGGRPNEHPTELMGLRGARLAYVEETGEEHTLDMTKLKRITGTERINARRTGHDFITFRPTHTLIVTTNHRPVVRDTDDGTWRRLQLLEFRKTFRGNDLDLGLRQRVLTGTGQQQAVLATIVSCAHDYLTKGLGTPPPTVLDATAAWRAENDVLYAFITRNLIAQTGAFTETTLLLTRFNASLPEHHQPWTVQTSGERLAEHPSTRAVGGTRGLHPRTRRAGFHGIALTPSDPAPSG